MSQRNRRKRGEERSLDFRGHTETAFPPELILGGQVLGTSIKVKSTVEKGCGTGAEVCGNGGDGNSTSRGFCHL